MSSHAKIGLAVHSAKFDSDDGRWRDQVGDLVHDLRTQADAVQILRKPVPGTKGTVDELVLTLGSAGVFTSTVEVLRAWLGRDKSRSVALTYHGRDGLEQHLQISATHAADDVFAPILDAVAHQIDAAP